MRLALSFAIIVGCHYPELAPLGSGGSDAMIDDATPTCADCGLIAIEPTVGNVGDTVTLEGLFPAAPTVNFPGGVTATATLLGANRAQVVVPAGTTTGSLSVSFASGSSAALPFHQVTFPLALNPFQLDYDQTSSARESSFLTTQRQGGSSVVIGKYVYAIGGLNFVPSESSVVERALINADDTLGSFAAVPGVALTTGRHDAVLAVLGGYVYVIGGQASGTALTSIERAPVAPDGTLGAFTIYGQTLTSSRTGATSAVVGASLYVLGGIVAGTVSNSIEVAPIAPDGTLGAFAPVTSSSLADPRAGAAAAVIGTYLYVIGGESSAALKTIERAPIDGTGALGTFTLVSPIPLVIARAYPSVAVLGNALYVIGGGDAAGTAPVVTIERSDINPDGTLAGFAIASNAQLRVARFSFSTVLVGNQMYALGGAGYHGNNTIGVEHASINGGGSLSSFTLPASIALPAARNAQLTATIGNAVYQLGGAMGATEVTDVSHLTVSADSSLGGFVADSTTLPAGSLHGSLAISGSHVYILGGQASSASSHISVAVIDADGTLGSFAIASQTLTTARYGAAAAFVTATPGNPNLTPSTYLYVMGGIDSSGTPASSIERASVAADGTLGVFAPVSIALPVVKAFAGVAVVGDSICLFGGEDTHPEGDIDCAAVQSSGDLAPFTTSTSEIAQGGLGRMGFAISRFGSSIYVLGGLTRNDMTPYTFSTTTATTAADGSIGVFAVGTPLTVAREFSSFVAIGNSFYVMGGRGALGDVSSTEQATLH